MRLYDEIINDILTDLSGQDVVKLPVGDAADPISRDWQDAGKAMMILHVLSSCSTMQASARRA